VRLTRHDLVREELTDDERESGAAVGECDIETADVAKLTKHRFSVTRDRLRADAYVATLSCGAPAST
jgi:hypothetical protein